MTAHHASVHHSSPHHASSHLWQAEARALVTLALPLIAGNIGWAAIAATDLLLLGRLGADAVAAGALALNLYNAFFVFGIGLTTLHFTTRMDWEHRPIKVLWYSFTGYAVAIYAISQLCRPVVRTDDDD